MALREKRPAVAVDGSAHGYGAVRYAAREAHRLGLPLDVVHVLPRNVPSGWIVIPDETFRSCGAEILERARETALESVAALDVETHLRSGGRTQQLLTFAEHALLLVLGDRSPHSLDRVWTGGTITGVASRATCPVVVVPADGEPDAVHHRIVVGFKSPAHAAELFDGAFPLADQLGAELIVLHAWRLQGIYDDIIAGRADVDRWVCEETRLIEGMLADYREAFPTVRVRVFVRHEDPARALVRAARGADRLLILRPAHGGTFHHLGRTARAVLRDGRCPVEVLAPQPPGRLPGAPPMVIERVGELLR
jgi:nucleotide-binding universal stress UspA family protein